MKYKMVVTDLDGTLLNDDKKISKDDVEILNKLHQSGIHIIIATGRNYFAAKMLTEQIKNLSPVILANNGAIVRYSESDEIIERNYLNPFYFEQIYLHGLKHGLNPVLHVDEYVRGYDVIYEKEDSEAAYLGYIRKDDKRAKLIKFSPKDINNILSACYLADFKKLDNFYKEIKQANLGNFNSFCNRNIGKNSMLEFLHIDGCKWRSLKKLAQSLQISPEEIISFGDDNNDVELILNSGLGIAMKNGTEKCIEAADNVSEYDNNSSGVSRELKKIFLL